MEEYGKSQVNFFKGLLIGGALGALAGILFAPKSGKKLRSDIREKGREILNDGKEILCRCQYQSKRDFWGSQASGEGVEEGSRRCR